MIGEFTGHVDIAPTPEDFGTVDPTDLPLFYVPDSMLV